MIEIVPHQSRFEDQVANLVLNIQQKEFNVPLTVADQPDLFTVDSFYRENGGEFWIAVEDDSRIVGSIAVIRIGNGNGVVRKMFVQKERRGKEFGIAQSLYDRLTKYAATVGIHSLYLGTIDRLHAAIRFYEKNGFQLVDKTELPADFPIMSVDNRFFKCVLSQ